jgi:hypothetical protein
MDTKIKKEEVPTEKEREKKFTKSRGQVKKELIQLLTLQLLPLSFMNSSRDFPLILPSRKAPVPHHKHHQFNSSNSNNNKNKKFFDLHYSSAKLTKTYRFPVTSSTVTSGSEPVLISVNKICKTK